LVLVKPTDRRRCRIRFVAGCSRHFGNVVEKPFDGAAPRVPARAQSNVGFSYRAENSMQNGFHFAEILFLRELRRGYILTSIR